MLPDEARVLPRLLIIAGFPPEGGGGGGVILRSLLEDYPGGELAWLALRPDRTKRRSWYRPEISRRVFHLYLPERLRALVGASGTCLIEKVIERAGVSFVRRVIAEHKPTDVLLVVDRSIVRMAAGIMDGNESLRFHLSIHDDPLVVADMSGIASQGPALAASFGHLLRRASSIDCISGRMALKYRREYGVEAMVITRCVEDSRLVELAQEPVKALSEEISLILSGWGDCPPPWPDNLMAALSGLRKQVRISFHTFDPRFKRFQDCGWVFVYEQMPEPEFNRLLATMDVSYAPDPLTVAGRQFAATSLSTKIVTSICAGKPFVYHGPGDSTVGDLLAQEPQLGVIVESEAPDAIACGILAACEHYPVRVNACREFAQRHFAAGVVRGKFLERLRSAPR